jgi:transposase
MDGRRVVFVAPRKDAGVVERFANHLEKHNATPAQIVSGGQKAQLLIFP